jgi:hypothetical protein
MLGRDDVNQWLERAASGGVADRSQMIDRVVDGSRGDARGGWTRTRSSRASSIACDRR